MFLYSVKHSFAVFTRHSLTTGKTIERNGKWTLRVPNTSHFWSIAFAGWNSSWSLSLRRGARLSVSDRIRPTESLIETIVADRTCESRSRRRVQRRRRRRNGRTRARDGTALELLKSCRTIVFEKNYTTCTVDGTARAENRASVHPCVPAIPELKPDNARYYIYAPGTLGLIQV